MRLFNKPFMMINATVLATLILIVVPSQSVAVNQGGIDISEDHINNLGVTLGKLTAVSQLPVLYAPARVVIPPTSEYVISTSQAGLITRLNAAIGDKVKQGELLAVLNSPDLLSLQRSYLKANSELELGKLAYDRDKKLLEEGAIAERRWQETRTFHSTLASEANERRQLLEIAGMTRAEIEQLQKSHHLSGLLNVRSPINGVVVERMAVAGSRIDPLMPLYRIANLDELWLEINIPQEHIAQIKLGDKVLLEKPPTEATSTPSSSAPLTPVTAQITLLGQSVNPESQTILARALIKGIDPNIRPGQRINTQIIQPKTGNAFSVPNTAIAQHEGKSFIFIRTAEGFKASPVAIIGKQGDDSMITGELTGTEIIATKGAVSLKANWLGLGSED